MRALFRGQLRRELNFDARVDVAFLLAVLADCRHAISLQSEHLPVLRQRRDLQADRFAGERRHFDFAAEHRGGHWQRRLDVEIASLALEELMRGQPYAQIQVSRRRAAASRFTFARNPDARSVADAGRDAHINRPRVAVVFQRQTTSAAVIGILERQLDLVLDIAALARACAGATCPGAGGAFAAAESAAEEGGKEVGERILISQHLLHFFLRHRPEAAAAARAAEIDVPLAPGKRIWSAGAFGLFVRTPVRAKLVVLLALGGIAEDLVGLVDLLELGVGRLVAGIDVRVMLARELAEGLLDLLVRRAFAHAERGVIVFEFHRRRAGLDAPPNRSLRAAYDFVEPANLIQQLPPAGARTQGVF